VNYKNTTYTLFILLFLLTLTACIAPKAKIIQSYDNEKVEIKEIDVFALNPEKKRMTYDFLGLKSFDVQITEKFEQIGVKVNINYYDKTDFKLPATGNYRLVVEIERARLVNGSVSTQRFRSILFGADNNQTLLSFSTESGNSFDIINALASEIVNTIQRDVLK